MTVCDFCKTIGGGHKDDCPFRVQTAQADVDAMVAKSYTPTEHDPVNHPSHYTAYKGVEIIDLTEQMNFNRGNAVKYIARAGLKTPETLLEDLKKARWYVDREIQRLEANDGNG